MNKSTIKHICFDLDGTLVDSKDTILESTKAALNQLNIEYKISEDVFNNMIGKHFVDIFRELKIDVNDFEHFISIYKSLYFDFIDSSQLYPGVKEILDYLNKKQIKVSLLTTKVQEQAEKIIDHFQLNTSVKPAETLIIGDTELDIQCGKNAGAQTCGVFFGYRSKKKIENENPDLIISRLDEIKNII